MPKKMYITKGINLACGECGVAFDVGAMQCNEQGCSNKQKLSPARKVDLVYARYSSAKARAKAKGLSFELSYKRVAWLIEQPCHYCASSNYRSELDRQDNSLGYTLINTVPCCRRCNTVKNSYINHEQMHAIVELLGWKH